ncbi:MAG: hypothetical protein U0905_15320 [Pirellulales bacterium]
MVTIPVELPYGAERRLWVFLLKSRRPFTSPKSLHRFMRENWLGDTREWPTTDPIDRRSRESFATVCNFD